MKTYVIFKPNTGQIVKRIQLADNYNVNKFLSVDEDYIETRDSTENMMVDLELKTLVPNNAVRAADIDDVKIRAITAIDNEYKRKIISGCMSSALGTEHLYPTNLVDQQNLAASVLSAVVSDDPEFSTPFWCQDDAGIWAFRMHSKAQIITVGNVVKLHITGLQAELEQIKADIENSSDVVYLMLKYLN